MKKLTNLINFLFNIIYKMKKMKILANIHKNIRFIE